MQDVQLMRIIYLVKTFSLKHPIIEWFCECGRDPNIFTLKEIYSITHWNSKDDLANIAKSPIHYSIYIDEKFINSITNNFRKIVYRSIPIPMFSGCDAWILKN